MIKAIHFICRRDVDGINLNGVTVVEKGPKAVYRTCCWDISEADANTLIGGSVYLHPRKSAPSKFGGRAYCNSRLVRNGKENHTRTA